LAGHVHQGVAKAVNDHLELRIHLELIREILRKW
jgi:hypothetical protein